MIRMTMIKPMIWEYRADGFVYRITRDQNNRPWTLFRMKTVDLLADDSGQWEMVEGCFRSRSSAAEYLEEDMAEVAQSIEAENKYDGESREDYLKSQGVNPVKDFLDNIDDDIMEGG